MTSVEDEQGNLPLRALQNRDAMQQNIDMARDLTWNDDDVDFVSGRVVPDRNLALPKEALDLLNMRNRGEGGEDATGSEDIPYDGVEPGTEAQEADVSDANIEESAGDSER